LWNHYQCGDGKWLALSMGGYADRFWPQFCEAMGIKGLQNDPRFKDMESRREHSEELISILDKVFATRPRHEWVKEFEKNNIVFDIVNTICDVVNDPQVIENDYIVDYDHPVLGKVRMVGCPIKFSHMKTGIRYPAPECGQHTEEVLTEICGYSREEVAKLKEMEVI